MSRITDELDASTGVVGETSKAVAAASGAASMVDFAIAELAAGATALDVARALLAREGTNGGRDVRVVCFDRTNGARAYTGSRDGLGDEPVAWERPIEATLRGHEVFLPPGADAESMALALALAGELAPAGEEREAASVAACLAVARRAIVARAADLSELLHEPELLDELVDAVEREPSAPSLATIGEGFGFVAVDAEGSLCAATIGDTPDPPVVALRFGRAFVGIAGPARGEALLLPLVRLVDRAAPAAIALDDLDALGRGDLVLVVREDAGDLDARADPRGEGAAMAQEMSGKTSVQA